MNIALIALSRPLSLLSPSSFSLSSLTTNCLAFTSPSSRRTSGPIAGHFSPSISSFFFSSDASGGHKFTRESGRAGGSAVYLSNNHHHGVEKQRNGGFGGDEAAGGYGTGMVGGVVGAAGGRSKHSDDFP